MKAGRLGLAMRDDPAVVALVTRAAGSDPSAWAEIVERYAPLVWSICTRFQLSNQDAEHVGQNVWHLLVEQLGRLREPAAATSGPPATGSAAIRSVSGCPRRQGIHG